MVKPLVNYVIKFLHSTTLLKTLSLVFLKVILLEISKNSLLTGVASL